MFILIIEDLGTKLQVSVLEVPIIDYCLAFSVVIACLSFPLIFKLLEGSDQLCITDLFIPMYIAHYVINNRPSINICKRKKIE